MKDGDYEEWTRPKPTTMGGVILEWAKNFLKGQEWQGNDEDIKESIQMKKYVEYHVITTLLCYYYNTL